MKERNANFCNYDVQQTYYRDISIICIVTVIMDVHPNTGGICKINTCAECTDRTFICTYESCAAWIHKG